MIDISQNAVYLGKAAPLVVSGATGIIKVVASLPLVGESKYLYGLLMNELDRDGYGIIQFFVWNNGEWLASGAYSIDIDPDTLLYKTDKNVANGVAGLNSDAQLAGAQIPYATSSSVGGIKQSFDATTGTWTVITESI